MSKYPESEKLRNSNVHDLRAFMEWLTVEREQPLELYQWDSRNDSYAVPCPDKPEDLIMEYLGIDQKKLEDERRAMVDSMRS